MRRTWASIGIQTGGVPLFAFGSFVRFATCLNVTQRRKPDSYLVVMQELLKSSANKTQFSATLQRNRATKKECNAATQPPDSARSLPWSI